MWENSSDMPSQPDPDFVPNRMQARVMERMRLLRLNAFQAAELGGFSDRKFVYDLVTNKKRGVQGDNLRALAMALKCDPEYLIGETDEPNRATHDEVKPTVWVRGKVAAGMWIEVTTEIDGQFQRVESPFPVDTRYPVSAQFDLVVQGSSVNRFARDGQNLRCVTIDGFGRDWREGDLVVALRFRGELRERTVKRAKRVQDRWVLVPESDDPRWEPIQLHLDGRSDDMDRVEVEGIVLYVYAVP